MEEVDHVTPIGNSCLGRCELITLTRFCIELEPMDDVDK